MRQKALAREAKAKEEEEASKQQPVPAAAGSGLELGPSDAQKVKEETPCQKGIGAEEPAACGTPCQKEVAESSADFGATSSSSSSSSPLREQKKQKLEEDKKEKQDPLPKGEGQQPKGEGQQGPFPKGGGRWVLKAESRWRWRVMVDCWNCLGAKSPGELGSPAAVETAWLPSFHSQLLRPHAAAGGGKKSQ